MPRIGRAKLADREGIENLIEAYHSSEGVIPVHERITSVVDQLLRGLFPGLLLVAREEDSVVGVAVAVYLPSAELGRVMNVHDFYVSPAYRRKGIGRELANRLVEECRLMKIDEIDLEVLPGNQAAAEFWKSIGLKLSGRILFKLKLR